MIKLQNKSDMLTILSINGRILQWNPPAMLSHSSPGPSVSMNNQVQDPPALSSQESYSCHYLEIKSTREDRGKNFLKTGLGKL